MNMKKDESGDFTIKSDRYSQNPLNIVDTGYGLERIAWITQGTETIYESVFPNIINWLKDNVKNNYNTSDIYSLADHTKCLAFMLGDGIVPSNVKAGYLARLIIRRSLRFIEKLQLTIKLKEIVNMQIDSLVKEFPSLNENINQIDELLDIETKKFSNTIKKGEGLVKRILKEKKIIDTKELINLYDTHGMPTDIVKNIADSNGVNIKIPENFDSIIAELHSHNIKEELKEFTRQNLPNTTSLYYENHYTKDFDAEVIWNNKKNNEYEIILNQTAFYPEGGGQPGDKGIFLVDDIEKIMP